MVVPWWYPVLRGAVVVSGGALVVPGAAKPPSGTSRPFIALNAEGLVTGVFY